MRRCWNGVLVAAVIPAAVVVGCGGASKHSSSATAATASRTALCRGVRTEAVLFEALAGSVGATGGQEQQGRVIAAASALEGKLRALKAICG
jgi:hypothetical protein